jgi:pyruvate/2-oxoglutarate/acetoin dehydrogenase E1 component/pyruvate/2-oxoglutarate dehydrogenase complex dihydrolipoamide acyltransferase (E2) component
VIDTPISEASFSGIAVGAALSGLRPVVEIMFMDFMTLAMDAIVNQAAKARFMFGGQRSVPLVFRTQHGGGVNAGPQHSQCLEAWFAHVPGLKVICPSDPGSAYSLLLAAIRDPDPVIFIEHKKLYALKGELPRTAEVLPIGTSSVLRAGSDVTIVSYGAAVHTSLAAAEILVGEGIEAEVIDLRTVQPWDQAGVLESLRRTHALVVAHEAVESFGVGAEIAARMSDIAFDLLDGPIVRVGAPYMPVPFAKSLESEYLPNAERIVVAARRATQCARGTRRAAFGGSVQSESESSTVELSVPKLEGTSILMPKLGLTMTEGVIVSWNVGVGARVRTGDILFTVETDKIATDVEARDHGEILSIEVLAGESVRVGERVGTWTGAQCAGDIGAAVNSAFLSRRPASNWEKVVARRLTDVSSTVPHFYASAAVEITALVALRERLNANPSYETRITLTHLILAAAARAHFQLPETNIIWKDDEILTYGGTDIGMVVETPRGLMVPIVRDAARLEIGTLANVAVALAEKARTGNLNPGELVGGAMSISNVGAHGASTLMPIINQGQSAILGVAAPLSVFRPDDRGMPRLAREITLTLACDHRVWNGIVAAKFLGVIRESIEDPLNRLVHRAT